MAKLGNQTRASLRLFDRVQILSLNILDQRYFQRFCVRQCAYNSGNLMQARSLCRAPAALTRNKLIPAGLHLPHQYRLNYAALSNALCQLL